MRARFGYSRICVYAHVCFLLPSYCSMYWRKKPDMHAHAHTQMLLFIFHAARHNRTMRLEKLFIQTRPCESAAGWERVPAARASVPALRVPGLWWGATWPWNPRGYIETVLLGGKDPAPQEPRAGNKIYILGVLCEVLAHEHCRHPKHSVCLRDFP